MLKRSTPLTSRRSQPHEGVFSRALGLSLMTLIACLGGTLEAAEPNLGPDFDPILDAPPKIVSQGLKVNQDADGSGLIVMADAGAYFGASSSYKASDLSTLYGGTRPRFGFRLGGQLKVPVEVTLGVILGFSETYENRDFDNALDVFTSLSVTYLPLSYMGWGLGAGAGLLLATYDVEDGSISQLAYGPQLAAKVTRDLSQNNQLYLDFSWAPIYNTTAFYLRDPTPEELEENPDAYKFKVKGEWGHLLMLSLGVRLFGF